MNFKKEVFPSKKKKFKNPLCTLKSRILPLKAAVLWGAWLGLWLLAFHTGWHCAECVLYTMLSHQRKVGGLSPNLHFSDEAQRNYFPKDLAGGNGGQDWTWCVWTQMPYISLASGNGLLPDVPPKLFLSWFEESVGVMLTLSASSARRRGWVRQFLQYLGRTEAQNIPVSLILNVTLFHLCPFCFQFETFY